jgi:AraC-like DNA-binding protein
MKRKQAARTDFLRLPGLANLELLHASNLTHDYPPHIHEQQCIVLVHQGSETTTVRGTAHTVLPGGIFSLDPEELHTSLYVDAEYRAFKIQAAEFRRIAGEVVGFRSEPPYFNSFTIEDAHSFRMLLRLYVNLEQNDSLLQQESEFLSTMAMLFSRHSKKNSGQKNGHKEDRHVDMIREYLKAAYRKNISLSELTLLTNLDRFYLLRVFANRVGVPPHEFQTQLRVAHARELIRRGSSISEAALETGFFDQSHLSRHFKRIVVMTPGEYLSGCNIVQESSRSSFP